MLFDDYLQNIPQLHTWDGGATWNSGGFEDYHLRAFKKYVGFGAHRVIETGAGNSSLAFLFGQASLVTIAPDQALFDRIATFARKGSLNISTWEKHVDRSEWSLPILAKNGREFDLALIDGGHGWPTVFVDFCYMNAMLTRGGILIIDDVQLHSIKELEKQLMADTDRFEFLENLGKSKVFRKKTNERFLPDWTDQPYIRRKSDSYTEALDEMAHQTLWKDIHNAINYHAQIRIGNIKRFVNERAWLRHILLPLVKAARILRARV